MGYLVLLIPAAQELMYSRRIYVGRYTWDVIFGLAYMRLIVGGNEMQEETCGNQRAESQVLKSEMGNFQRVQFCECSVICHIIWFDVLIGRPKGAYFLCALTGGASKKSWEMIFCLCVRLSNSLIPFWREDRKWIYCLEITMQKKRSVWIWLSDPSEARGLLGSALGCLSIPSNKAEADSALTFRAPFVLKRLAWEVPVVF